jgi:hypothetical protein
LDNPGTAADVTAVFIIGGGYGVRRAGDLEYRNAGVDVCIIHGGSGDLITTSVGPAVGTGRLVYHCNISGHHCPGVDCRTWVLGRVGMVSYGANRVQIFRLRPADEVSASIPV